MNKSSRKIIFLGSVVLVSTLVSLELAGKALLARRADPYSLFYQGSQTSSLKRVFLFPLLDPLLGWGRQPPFREYFSADVPESERELGFKAGTRLPTTKRIVAMGGSTTDPEMEAKNWVFALSEICSRKHLRCQALNGGIGGYASPQEVLKLTRDVQPLQPDVVISLNGINDESLPVFDGRTFVNNHQAEIERALTSSDREADSPLANPPAMFGPFPHARFLWQVTAFLISSPKAPENRVPIGTVDRFPLSRRWEWDVRMMHALGEEFGFKYFVFLQPHLGLEPEIAKQKLAQLGISYTYDSAHLQKFYEEAREACHRLSYCADLSKDFLDKSSLFADVMHLNAEGHAIEAEKMFTVLRQKGVL